MKRGEKDVVRAPVPGEADARRWACFRAPLEAWGPDVGEIVWHKSDDVWPIIRVRKVLQVSPLVPGAWLVLEGTRTRPASFSVAEQMRPFPWYERFDENCRDCRKFRWNGTCKRYHWRSRAMRAKYPAPLWLCDRCKLSGKYSRRLVLTQRRWLVACDYGDSERVISLDGSLGVPRRAAAASGYWEPVFDGDVETFAGPGAIRAIDLRA